MKYHITPLICVALLSCATLFSQTVKKKTDVNKDVDVTRVYEQVVKDGYGSPQIYKDLANAYYFKNNYSEAKKWYELLFESEKPKDATIRRRYKQTLKALKQYDKNNVYLAVSGTN
jgi:tetratricopeptide (TPR) repeat protein